MTTPITEDGLAELWLSVGELADLNLTGDTVNDDGVPFTIEALADDTTWGNPVPIDVTVQRWMTDGAVTSTEGNEDRTLSFKIVVSATSTIGLTAGEAELVKRSDQIGTLTWISPEGAPDAPPTVFELWNYHLEHIYDDQDEFELSRTWQVTATAKPYVRSKDLTVSVAPIPAGLPTTLEVDTCDNALAWTGSPHTPTALSGAVHEATTVSFAGSGLLTLTRTGSVTGFGTTPYLMLDTSLTGATAGALIVKADGKTLTKSAQIGTVSYWKMTAASFSVLSVTCPFQIPHAGTVTFSIADVSRTDTIGSVGSAKQLARSLTVGGSVKTSGSIQVASPSSTALGTVLIYTGPAGSGYTPPMRQYRTSGTTVSPDASCASGNHEALVNAGASAGVITYTVADGLLPQEANFVVVGRFIMGSAATLSATVAANVAGFSGANQQKITADVVATAAGVRWAVLGVLSLPAHAMPAESTLAQVFTLTATADTGTHTVDELYLIDITHGAMTLLQAGTGKTRVWLDAPDADPVRNRPAFYAGTSSTRSDAAAIPHDQITALGDHDLQPGGSFVFSVTDNVNNAAVSASFYHRWHTHAGD